MQQAGARPSVVLVTIDCWREDALRHMPALDALTCDWRAGTAISQAAATNGAFAALFASEYYPLTYDASGAVRPHIVTISSLLRLGGYRSAAFVAGNPWLEKWREHFGRFWNDSIVGSGDTALPRGGRLRRWPAQAFRFLAMRTAVPARKVLARAWDWYRRQVGPKLLWVHLMDAHEPYLPGLARACQVGLRASYRALLAQRRRGARGDGLGERERAQLRKLYGKCLEGLDGELVRFIRRLDEVDAVLLLGDHGEEFEHGLFRHARLYEECVRTPFRIRWPEAASLPEAFCRPTLRHLDVAPALAVGLGLEPPPSWKGNAAGTDGASLLINASPKLGEAYVGLREPDWKYIRTHALDTGRLKREELYHLARDPHERCNLAENAAFAREKGCMAAALDRELERLGLDPRAGVEAGVGGIEQALRDLGYL